MIGEYPLETYIFAGKPIQDMPARLEFIDTWYLHTTHLKRSSWLSQLKTLDRLKKFKLFGKRLTLAYDELPKALR